jgi:hypothetical protein
MIQIHWQVSQFDDIKMDAQQDCFMDLNEQDFGN